MSNNLLQIYKKESESKVFLEEENHIYIDKKTGYFYNSVTGVLSLIKNEFETDEVISGITRQYTKFKIWFDYNRINYDNFVRYLSLYVNYRQFTDRCEKEWDGKKYNGYVHDLKDYASVEEFYHEYIFLEEAYGDTIDRKKNIYIDKDYNIMNSSAIQEMWKDMTDIANHYGNIIHITLEREILEKQKILDYSNDHLMVLIQDHFFWIKKHLPLFYEKYPNSKHSFTEYEIDCTLGELMAHIIIEFYKVHQFKGLCVIPEKRLLYKNLAGTKDIHEVVSNSVFDTGDHKTNKDLSVESKYGNKLLPPFDDIDESELNLYTFQLSIYSFMEEQLRKVRLRNQYITYYDRRLGNFKKFDIEYKKDEAEYLINYSVEWIEERKQRYLKSSLGSLIKQQIKPEWMDHFSKQMYYFIKKSKKENNTNPEIYKNFILDYRKKHINITYANYGN